MNKIEFTENLRARLKGLPQKDIDDSIDYYTELIDDRIEEGMTEEEAVKVLGKLDDIAAQIIGTTSLPKMVKEKIKSGRSLQAWEIVLIVLGFPLWFPLLLSFGAILISAFAVIGSVIISIFAVSFAAGACAVAFIIAAPFSFGSAMIGSGMVFTGTSLVSAAFCILFFIAAIYCAKGTLWLIKKIVFKIKSCFVKKEKKA